jgi:hypothetical protein
MMLRADQCSGIVRPIGSWSTPLVPGVMSYSLS